MAANASTVEVRKAAASDTAAITALVSRAFFADPVMRWAIPDDERRRRINRAFFELFSSLLLQDDETASNLSGSCLGCRDGGTTAGARRASQSHTRGDQPESVPAELA